MEAFIRTLSEENIIKVLSFRGLETTYNGKEELIERCLQCLTNEDTIESITEILLFEDDKFHESFSEQDMSTNFTFRDVEDALEKFSGESETSLEVWLAYFEDVAKTCKWNEIQKYLFARKLLTGAAKKAILADRKVITYALLEAKLKAEFPEKLTSIEIHEKLSKRKKNTSETYLEYFYEMQRIGATKMDEHSMIQYIVNGIQDSALGKAMLYDATSLVILKAKLKTYETMKNQRDMSVKQKGNERKSSDQSHGSSESMSTNASGKRCYNCGSKSHQSNQCPDKAKGTRCFQCNNFGHRAKDCIEKKVDPANTNQAKPIRTIASLPKPDDSHIYVQCGENYTSSLVDSGSWVTVMRKSMFDKLRHKPDMEKTIAPFKGFGNIVTSSVGSFDCLVIIEDDIYDVECWIVKDEDITDDMIIGLDIINQGELVIRRGKVTLKKLMDDGDEGDETFINKIKAINCVVKCNEPDLSHIKDRKARETIAKPLTDLTRKDIKFEFSNEQQDAFISLKAVLCDKPILNMYNPAAKKTELHTDASKLGFGAVLMQRDSEDQKMHPVYYLSYKTTPAQQKYESYDLETLAIYKAVKKLRVYLLGLKFEVFTDCQAFERSMLKKELIPRIAKWALYISQFDCRLVHQPGTKMKHVDALSRIPRIMLIEDGLVAKLRQMQREDDRCKTILKILETKTHEDFVNRRGILYKWTGGDTVLVVPNKMQKELIRAIHEKGHLSARKVETVVKRDYFIEKLSSKVSDVISNCIACILANRKEGKKDGLLNPIDKGDVPLHTYHIDHMGPLKSTAKSYNHLLMVIDAFSKFTWIYPVKTKDVAEVVKTIRLI